MVTNVALEQDRGFFQLDTRQAVELRSLEVKAVQRCAVAVAACAVVAAAALGAVLHGFRGHRDRTATWCRAIDALQNDAGEVSAVRRARPIWTTTATARRTRPLS